MPPHGYKSLLGQDPNGTPGEFRDYHFSIKELNKAYKFAPVKIYNLSTAEGVLQAPKEIWRGIRDEREDWLCFWGQPSRWFPQAGVEASFPKGMVYCVFVNERRVAYEWRKERALEFRPGTVVEWPDCTFRFRERIWPTPLEPKRSSRGSSPPNQSR
jgi:hypothetical protein